MKRKIIGTYVGSVSGLVILIILAVFSPQLFFLVQDNYQIGKIDVINRDVTEIFTTQTAYYTDTYARLSNLAEVGLGNIAISTIESNMDIEQFYEIKDNIRTQMYMEILMDMVPDTFGDALDYISVDNMELCKCYIIYGEDYTEGVLLMFWYMKIYLPSVNSYMELVIDSETYTIYYVAVNAEADISYQVEYEVSADSAKDVYYTGIVLEEEVMEQEEKMLMSEDIQRAADLLPRYLEDFFYSYYGVYGYRQENSYNMVIGEEAVTIACPLIYGDSNYNFNDAKSLFFRAYVEEGYGEGPDISIGIPIIRHFVIN